MEQKEANQQPHVLIDFLRGFCNKKKKHAQNSSLNNCFQVDQLLDISHIYITIGMYMLLQRLTIHPSELHLLGLVLSKVTDNTAQVLY